MAKRGRKSTYKVEYAQKLINFFDIEPYEDRKIPHYEKTGKKDEEGNRVVVWNDIKRLPNKLPTLRDFAKKIKVNISTVYNWLNPDHNSFQKEFLDAFTQAKEIRKDFLIQNALQGLYPPATFKFVAVNMTDMVDKTEQDWGDKTRQTITDIAAQMAGKNGD